MSDNGRWGITSWTFIEDTIPLFFPMPEKLESLRTLTEAGYLPVSEYIAARREWLMAELAATERRLQSLVLSWNDRDEAIEYAKDLRNELNGEKAHG
jgi:hypothetical protein